MSENNNKTKKLKRDSEVGKNEPHAWRKYQIFVRSHHVDDASLVERLDSKQVIKGGKSHLNVTIVTHSKKSKRKKEEKKKLREHHQIDL